MSFIRRLFQKKTLKTPLGRWAISKTQKEQQIKITMANHDSCGGLLCETPIDLKQEVIDIAAKYPSLGIKLLIIDTERKFIASGFGKELADAANGKYVQLPKATDKTIAAMALNAINEL